MSRWITLESDIGITVPGDYRGGCRFVVFWSMTRTAKKALLAFAAVGIAVGGVVGGIGPAVGTSVGISEDTSAPVGGVGAVGAAESLASGTTGTSYFSEELIEALGYTPGLQNGHATNPDGDCSSPVELPTSFEPACKTHDLGYDLLRVADRTGETIPTDLRASLDGQMAEQMRATCDTAGCRVMATAAHVGVGANTVRQGNGAPVAEQWTEWLPW